MPETIEYNKEENAINESPDNINIMNLRQKCGTYYKEEWSIKKMIPEIVTNWSSRHFCDFIRLLSIKKKKMTEIPPNSRNSEENRFLSISK